jgi:Reverse transcriptase (RNA-dependent DNA polymerase)
MTYLYPLPLKTALEVRNTFMEFRNVFEQDGRHIKSIRTDGGGEYRKQMAELCRELGINHEETAPYTPHQNGVAERANRTICERIRSIIAETKLPKELWAELARTVVYLKNRSPTRSLKDKTPYEALYGAKPDLSHLIAVGTKAMPHIPKSKNQKLDTRAGEGIMVGYGGSNQYRIWNPVDNKVTVTAYADFINEAKNHTPAAEPERIIYDMIEILPGPPETHAESDDRGEVVEGEDADDADDAEDADDNELETVTIDAREESSEHAQQPQEEPRLPPRRRAPPKRYDSEAWMTHAALSTTTTDSMEPRTYLEAVNHPLYSKEWELAIKEEYDSLMKNGAWELVEAPPGRNIVTCKWVFKAKRDAEGRIVRFKARLVARGFTQAYGVDYLETYAPVAKLTTYRIIFALAALEQWEIHGMDVITAFLLGKLDEEIFMMQPEGFERQGMKTKMVCRLLRSLYGLKQASRVWNMQLHEFLVKIGFRRSNADTCLYVNVEISIFIAIWVDDILIAGKGARNIAKVKKQLAGEFSMKDLGQITHFLGMRITRTADGDISIDQSTYVKDILVRFGMEDSKPVSTPLTTGTKLTKDDANSARNEIQPLYQSIVGSLMYAMLCTRPDIAHTVQQLSQFASDPAQVHLQAAKRALRYLQGTQDFHLTYRRDNGDTRTDTIQSYSDADFAAGEDRKSISGYIFILAGAPISWQAKKQSTIALSTAEAEYAALTHAAKEVIWLQNLLKDFGMTKYAPRIINVDNQGTIALAENPIHHARTKHLDVQLQFVRDHVERNTIELRYCPTDAMLADIMTKALAKEKHAAMRRLIGMGNTTPSPFEDGRF